MKKIFEYIVIKRYAIILILFILIKGLTYLPYQNIIKSKGQKGKIASESSKNAFFQDNTHHEKKNLKKDFIIITDKEESDSASNMTLENLKDIFEFSKINYEIVDREKEKIDFSSYRGIIILLNSFYNFDKENYIKIKEATEKGATLFFFGYPNKNNPFLDFIGIEEAKEIKNSENIKFLIDIYPGIKELQKVNKYYQTSYMSVTLNKEAKILGVNEKNEPLYWEVPKNKGKVIYINNSLHEDKSTQGIMKQVISYGNDYFITPTLNSKVIQLDDFPAPFQGRSKNIMKDYGLNNEEFIKEVWMPDMETIAEKYNLKYTSFFIVDYGVEATKYELDKYKNVDTISLLEQGKDFLRTQKLEIGIHGYNHNPLSMEDGIDYIEYDIYSPWDSVNSMILAQEKFKEIIAKVLGKDFKIYSYVAPNNLLTFEGKEALNISFPTLKSICGIFRGSGTPGEAVQKVGVDPDFPRFYDFPRFSFGYENTDSTFADIFNGVAAYGYISHFMHPDDIFANDERTFTQSWKVMKKNFIQILEKMNSKFPYLKPMFQIQLAREFYKMENIQIESTMRENKLELKTYNYTKGFYTELRVRNRKIVSMKNGEYKEIHKDDVSTIYLVRIKGEKVQIELTPIL